MGIALVPLMGSAVGAVESKVAGEVKSLISGAVGFIDPGKQRDAQRSARADAWYKFAAQGSLYAARHVYGGFTSPWWCYTIKEKKYYQDHFAQLKASNPTLAARAQAIGGISIPDNFSADDEAAITADLGQIEVANATAATYGQAPPVAVSFTPSGANVGPVTVLPAVTSTVNAPTLATAGMAPASTGSKLPLIIGALLLIGLAGFAIIESRK